MSQMGDALAEPTTEAPGPERASTPAEYTLALRALRIWSGLTYRQLEGKANAHRDALPASTIATTLGRATLPRERFVDAFIRACGLGEEEVDRWLRARQRIATDEQAPADDVDGSDSQVPPSEEPHPVRHLRWRRAVALVVAVGLGAAGALSLSNLSSGSEPPAGPPAMPVTGLHILAVGSWARIHPARTPEFCLTEGRDRTGRYKTAVAAQRHCTETVLPRVFLEPLSKDIVQIQWHHPKYSIGCLTVLPTGQGRNLLEPRNDCADNNKAQQFRLELFGPPAAGHFRLHPVSTGQCLSLRDEDTEAGAEIVQGRCSGATDQEFLIELIPPA
ncbi:XRE family transcriptional regulator [Streptomyces rubrogriseus]|uniref:XRE family transcriptional regulator n=1 Tax=Streptomyces rubrogriseus TaxID=194673 RepID=A0A6G3TB21_9ACTN|nr:XRE family transcriptional regulator [Streptomyces rubrogriseus]NEC33812.1 XRE family transcriptional regulator [Streptomyces rubrogriseus]